MTSKRKLCSLFLNHNPVNKRLRNLRFISSGNASGPIPQPKMPERCARPTRKSESSDGSIKESATKIRRMSTQADEKISAWLLKRRKSSFNLSFDDDYKFTILPSPEKAPLDKKEYRVIQLENGLRALLVSDMSRSVASVNSTYDSEDSAEGEEGDSEDDSCADEEADEEETEEEGEEDEEESGCAGSVEEMEEEDEDAESLDGSEPEGHRMKHEEVTRYLAAASLCIGSGSFEDPPEIPGLMHFLEHMVYMGSEKYPKENSFDAFIKKHGGSDNAHTDMENTTFYFEVQERNLLEGLDRWAQFFIDPLMSRCSMKREREAVHSEFQMAIPEDEFRSQQLFASFAREGHPMSKFTWGNESTLNLEIPDEELHRKLHELRVCHYSSQFMTLAVQARMPLATLQEWVVGIFSKVPKADIPPPTYDHLGFPFPKEKFHHICRMVPMKEYHSLEINWALPSQLTNYRSKPLHYISHLLGHEGLGSILSYLKKRVWAVGLYAGNDESGFEHNTTYAVFSISVELTDDGFKNIHEVMRVVFQYLNMLRKMGPVRRIFDEIQKIERLDFDYAEEPSAVENVEWLAENMQLYPPEDYLTGDTRLYEFRPEIITTCLSHLIASNCNMIVSSKTFEAENICTEIEKWFGTKYIVEDFPAELESELTQVPENIELHLPAVNPFIPDHFELLPQKQVSPYPQRLCHDSLGELWYRQDVKFGLPRAYCYLHLFSNLLLESPKNAVLLDLQLNLYLQHIMEELYPANTAQYSFSAIASERGLILKVNGFNQKLPKVFELVLDHLKNFEDHLQEKAFYEMKTQLLKTYYNAILKPASVRRDTRLSLLQSVHWTAEEKLRETDSVDVDQLRQFAAAFLPSCHFRMLVQGNIEEDEAKNLYEMVVANRGETPKEIPLFPEIRTMQFQSYQKIVRVKNFNMADTNSCVLNYYQGEPGNMMEEVLYEFLLLLMDEPAFDFLRTKEQLGYHVCCTNRNTHGILGISITVNTQANRFSVSHVDERMEVFLKNFVTRVSNLTNEDFDHMKETLRSSKQTIDLTIKDEVERNWNEIVDGEYVFDRLKRQIALIEEITPAVALQRLRSLVVSTDNPSYRKLSVQVVGAETPEFAAPTLDSAVAAAKENRIFEYTHNDEAGDCVYICDLPAYKRTLHCYPVTKIV